MRIYVRFSTQKVIKNNRQKRRKRHETGNQKNRQKAHKSAHRQGQLQHLRLVVLQPRGGKTPPHFTQGVKHGMQN